MVFVVFCYVLHLLAGWSTAAVHLDLEWSPLRQNVEKRYFKAMVGFTQPFFITPCDGRKLR